MDKKPTVSRDDLRNTAVCQKGILFCILGQIVVVILQFFLPPELKLIVPIAGVPISVIATVFVFLLAIRIYSVALGILLGILTLIPCVGLFVLLIINGKATAFLTSHGVRVGLLGAKMSDIK